MASLHIAQEILDIIYPIGSVYISVNTTNPSTLFGGGWTRITGKFLLGADDSTYKNGATGGEATHTLTINEIPQMDVHMSKGTWFDKGGLEYGGAVNRRVVAGGAAGGDTTYIIGTVNGGGQTHNNMPPYLVVYMWKRTS